MHIELLKKIAEETMGKPAVDLIVILLKKKNIDLNRKVLAEIAQKYPLIFNKIVESAK